jgi:hypothetical protein
MMVLAVRAACTDLAHIVQLPPPAALHQAVLLEHRSCVHCDTAAAVVSSQCTSTTHRAGAGLSVIPCPLPRLQVSSVEIERAVVEGVPSVVEAAAIGLGKPGGGPEQLHLFVVLRLGDADGGATDADSAAMACKSGALLQQCQEALRSRLNPLFKVRVMLCTHVCASAAGSCSG